MLFDFIIIDVMGWRFLWVDKSNPTSWPIIYFIVHVVTCWSEVWTRIPRVPIDILLRNFHGFPALLFNSHAPTSGTVVVGCSARLELSFINVVIGICSCSIRVAPSVPFFSQPSILLLLYIFKLHSLFSLKLYSHLINHFKHLIVGTIKWMTGGMCFTWTGSIFEP